MARYMVEVLDQETAGSSELAFWEPWGSVLLPPRANRWDVEAALASLGLYAPRGADGLWWRGRGQDVWALIGDGAHGNCPMIRLVDARASHWAIDRKVER